MNTSTRIIACESELEDGITLPRITVYAVLLEHVTSEETERNEKMMDKKVEVEATCYYRKCIHCQSEVKVAYSIVSKPKRQNISAHLKSHLYGRSADAGCKKFKVHMRGDAPPVVLTYSALELVFDIERGKDGIFNFKRQRTTGSSVQRGQPTLFSMVRRQGEDTSLKPRPKFLIR